jgi:hypothetical protein
MAYRGYYTRLHWCPNIMKTVIVSFFHKKTIMRQQNSINEEDKTIWNKRILIKEKSVVIWVCWGCIRLVESLLFSVLLYGCETWTVSASDEKRIEAFEMWCWRRMLRVSWMERRTNASIMEELKVPNRLSTHVNKRMLQFFGHVVRREPWEDYHGGEGWRQKTTRKDC